MYRNRLTKFAAASASSPLEVLSLDRFFQSPRYRPWHCSTRCSALLFCWEAFLMLWDVANLTRHGPPCFSFQTESGMRPLDVAHQRNILTKFVAEQFHGSVLLFILAIRSAACCVRVTCALCHVGPCRTLCVYIPFLLFCPREMHNWAQWVLHLACVYMLCFDHVPTRTHAQVCSLNMFSQAHFRSRSLHLTCIPIQLHGSVPLYTFAIPNAALSCVSDVCILSC